ncbi:MAG: type II toxin-antitoxin system Phd/YefM family antitoxin [Desulfobacterales bacterium]|nr:type II toxin-antitoxin system Phd/YefM family antitoxin [Desulfobacterales bacterium]
MQTLNIHEAKTKLSAVLMQIEKTGDSFVICRNGKPVAELIPYKQRKGGRLAYHPVMSEIRIDYDPTDPLTDDEWGELGPIAGGAGADDS